MPATPPLIASSRSALSGAALSRRLRLAQFAVFEKVVETGSLLAASRELAMTQPAVSKSMRELEQQLGGALFVRSKRGAVLTEFGHLFARHARTVMAGLHDMAEEMQAAQAGLTGSVVVGTMMAASSGLLPEAIARLREHAPELIVSIQVGPNATLFPMLARGDLDLVVGFLPHNATALMRQAAEPVRSAAATHFMHIPLYDESLTAVVATDHALAGKKTVDLADLSRLEWILPTQESVAHATVRAFFESHGLGLPRRRVESLSVLTNIGLLQRRPMVALMPELVAVLLQRAGLVAMLPLPGTGSFGSVGYTLRSERVRNRACQHLLEALHAVADGLHQEYKDAAE